MNRFQRVLMLVLCCFALSSAAFVATGCSDDDTAQTQGDDASGETGEDASDHQDSISDDDATEAPDATEDPDAVEDPDTTDDPDAGDTCAPGMEFCDGTCVSTEDNAGHCGACDNVCARGESCVEGACQGPPVICGGRAGNPCAAEEFCDYPDDTVCDFSDGQGVCAPRPTECAAGGTPVCGCNGETYVNECEANRAGSDLRGDGACVSI